jgi:hypothetical protein
MKTDRLTAYEEGLRSTKPQEWILVQFEQTRPRHGGVIGDAACHLGMTPTALQRALYRAKKKGWDGFFTTARARARFA